MVSFHYQKQGKYISLAGLFLGLFIFIIICSFIYKGVNIALKSTIDPSHQYIFGLVTKADTKEVVILNGNPHTLTSLTFKTKDNISQITNSLRMPVDYLLQRKISSDNSIQSELSQAIFSEKAINFFDKIKLWWSIKSLLSHDVQSQVFKLPFDPLRDDKMLNTIFLDNDIYQENKNISVVNAAGVTGLGSIISEYMTRIGVHVISVTTANTVQDNSTITFSGKKGYTVSRLERMLQLTASAQQQNTISDIIVTIGKDRVDRF